MQLIPNWQSIWRFWSVRVSILTGFFDVAAANNWWHLLDKLGTDGVIAINAVIATLIIPLLRSIQQNPPVSPEVKQALIEKVEAVPTKP